MDNLNGWKVVKSVHVHPFDQCFEFVGDWIAIPKEVRELKEKDPERYQCELEKIAISLRVHVKEKLDPFFETVIRDGDGDLHTVGVKIGLYVDRR